MTKSAKSILNQSSYQQQINSPEWRTFSSNIKAKRRFCECCRRADVVTQVHHLFYDWTRKLYEYDGSEVVVLCEGCHKGFHEQLNNFRKFIFRYLTPGSFQVLNGALAVGLTQYDPLVFCHALAEFTSNPRLVESYAKSWGMSSSPKTGFEPQLDPKQVRERMDSYEARTTIPPTSSLSS